MKKHPSVPTHHNQLLTKTGPTVIWCGTRICRYCVCHKDPEGRRFPLVLPKRDSWGFSDSLKQATVMHMHRDSSETLLITAMASTDRIKQGFEYEIPRLGTHSLWLGASDDFINTNNFVNQATPFLFHLEF